MAQLSVGRGSSPEPRVISRVGSSIRSGTGDTPSSCRNSRSAAVRPSCAASCATTVTPGRSRSPSSMSSKPTSATGRSISDSTRTTVTVTRLLPAKIAVTGSGPASISSAARRTRSGSVTPSDIQASSTSVPASSIAVR